MFETSLPVLLATNKLTNDALALGVDDATWQQMKVIFTILNYYSVPCVIASLQHKL
jgi:hypothetical protein